MENKAGLMLFTNSYGRNWREDILKRFLNHTNAAFRCRHLGVKKTIVVILVPSE